MKHSRIPWGGHAWGLVLMLLLPGCGTERGSGVSGADENAATCKRLIAQIESGRYTTYRSRRHWTGDVVRVNEIHEFFKHKEAYPWLIRALDSKDENVAGTVMDFFCSSSTPGSLNPESLLRYYAVPDNELVWNGFMWRPRDPMGGFREGPDDSPSTTWSGSRGRTRSRMSRMMPTVSSFPALHSGRMSPGTNPPFPALNVHRQML